MSATVAAIATLAVTAAPTGLTLTPQDIRRGSVTVTEPMVLLIRSNSAQGIALDIRAAATLFSAVSVHGLEGDAMIAGEGGTLTHRWAHAQPLPLALSFTFYLTSAAQAGTYAWPLSLRVRALETL